MPTLPGGGGSVTVSVAALEAALPAVFVHVNENVLPLSPERVPGGGEAWGRRQIARTRPCNAS